MPTLEIKQVTKRFQNGVQALDAVTFSIESGVFGLLGHNGAGKTTLMRMIATLTAPTAGTISVMGHDVLKEGDAVRRAIGYLPQEISMYANLSVFDFVRYIALLKGVRSEKDVISALEDVDMLPFRKRKIGQLSGGMKRRIGIAQALVGRPSVLIVDEPTAGLDPEERIRFRGVLSRYAAHGRTVLLSTHIVEDVHHLCPRLAVLRKGRLYFNGTQQELLNQVAGKVKLIECREEQELTELRNHAVVLSTTFDQEGVKARIVDDENRYTAAKVNETLEDAYVYSMGGKSDA